MTLHTSYVCIGVPSNYTAVRHYTCLVSVEDIHYVFIAFRPLSHVNVWRVLLIPSRVKVASSVNSVNGSTWRLVCNQWKNSRCMALSTGCSFCTRCGWCGSRASSCNVRHTYVRETPSSRDSNCVPISSFWVGNRKITRSRVGRVWSLSNHRYVVFGQESLSHDWNNGTNQHVDPKAPHTDREMTVESGRI